MIGCSGVAGKVRVPEAPERRTPPTARPRLGRCVGMTFGERDHRARAQPVPNSDIRGWLGIRPMQAEGPPTDSLKSALAWADRRARDWGIGVGSVTGGLVAFVTSQRQAGVTPWSQAAQTAAYIDAVIAFAVTAVFWGLVAWFVAKRIYRRRASVALEEASRLRNAATVTDPSAPEAAAMPPPGGTPVDTAPPSASALPPGWYERVGQPEGRECWWDGAAWSGHVRRRENG